MTTTSARPGLVTRMVAWAADAADGIAGWLVVCAIVAGFGFWFVPGDYKARNVARDVNNGGIWVIATDVEAHVDYESSKGGGWYEVDRVRARLPRSNGWTDLDAVANEDTLPESREWHEGWQRATGITGYGPPLRVKVLFDGDGTVKRAVAERDITYWTDDNRDPEIGLSIGFGSLLVALMSLGIKSRLTRRTGWGRLSSRPRRSADPGRC